MKFLFIVYTLFLHKKKQLYQSLFSIRIKQDKELMIIHFKNHFKQNDLFIFASQYFIICIT